MIVKWQSSMKIIMYLLYLLVCKMYFLFIYSLLFFICIPSQQSHLGWSDKAPHTHTICTVILPMSASSIQILLYQQVWQSPDLRQLDVLVIPCIGLVIVGKEGAACHFVIIFHLFWESYETVAIPMSTCQ